jgi:hypothetical protein
MKLSEQFESARERLWANVNIGELSISSRSVDALKTLMREIEQERFDFEQEGIDDSNFAQVFSAHCEKLRSLIDSRIPSLLDYAKSDLR